jgi:hypothetical protein
VGDHVGIPTAVRFVLSLVPGQLHLASPLPPRRTLTPISPGLILLVSGYHQQKRWLPDCSMSGWDVGPDNTDLRQVCSLIFQ